MILATFNYEYGSSRELTVRRLLGILLIRLANVTFLLNYLLCVCVFQGSHLIQFNPLSTKMTNTYTNVLVHEIRVTTHCHFSMPIRCISVHITSLY